MSSLSIVGQKSNVSHINFFCYTCFLYLSATQRDKLDLKEVKCIFLGYSQTKKGYKYYDSISKKSYISKDIRFVETNPYFEGTNKGGDTAWVFFLPSIDSGHDNHDASVSPSINASAPTQD
jgi:hypothetical protein